MSKGWTFAIFLVAVVARLAFLGLAYDGPDSLRQPDSPAFELPAQGLAEHGVIGLPTADGTAPQPFTERAPGYILFLAAVRLVAGPSPLVVVLLQILLDGLTCVAVARLAGQVRTPLARPAGILAALAPNMIISSTQVLSDAPFLLPFTLFLTATLAAVERRCVRQAALAGLWLGLATLIRPTPWILILVMPPVVAALVPGWRRRATLALALFATAAAMVTPWLARNAAVAGHWQLISQTGTHALYWVVPLTREYGAGIPPEQTKALMNERLAARLAAEGLDALPADPFQSSAIMGAVAREALLESGPLVMARAWTVGAAVNLLSPALVSAPPVQRLPRPSFYETPGGSITDKLGNYLGAAAGTPYFWILAAGLAGTALARLGQVAGLVAAVRGGWSWRSLAVLAVVAAYLLAITGPITGVKYRLPLEPILILLLAEAALRVGRRNGRP